MEYNKNKAKGYTLPYDTPYQQHMKRVKEITSNVSPTLFFSCKGTRKTKCIIASFFKLLLQLKYKEVYEKSKAQINIDPEAHEIRAAKEAYQNITNVNVSSQVSFSNHHCYNKLNFT